MASWRDLSASSRIWLPEPLNIILHASFLAHPENLIILSSPIIISEMLAHYPRVAGFGASKVERISAPRTAESLSIPSKSACSITITPASARSCSG